ncbi:outer membrane protein [Leisingera methylohalidivorans]|uniref:Outer membrane protein beta-barrel domain-containing protein n=1 Tax=Leisingera methylohalidivorans DSM 14336 TaxID=999552 RepID=V9VZ96_9RHOB|nr:hypothetical protein [Leisingera methylohalidivorans]AHD03104.1 hypothetical protein METH_11635 [Leisingera methylohalidivorans DSM 14336]
MPGKTATRRCANTAVLVLAGGCLAAGGTAGDAWAQGAWRWQLTPFVLAPSVEGTTELGLAGGGVSIDAGDVFDQLQAGGMLAFEGRHISRFGFRLRYAVMDSDQTAGSSAGAVAAAYDQNIAEAVVTYRFGQGRDRVEVFGGLRHWDVDVTAFLPGGAVRRGGTWTDPIAGLRWERRLSPRFSLSLEGDIGGFGAGSDRSWSAMGGLIYHRWERASIYVMYRGLGVDYQDGTRGTDGFFRHDAETHGLLAGVGFRF